MQIIMNKDTKMRFKLDLVYLKTGEVFYMSFATLDAARDSADWAENNGCRIERLVLELES